LEYVRSLNRETSPGSYFVGRLSTPTLKTLAFGWRPACHLIAAPTFGDIAPCPSSHQFIATAPFLNSEFPLLTPNFTNLHGTVLIPQATPPDSIDIDAIVSWS